MLPPGCPEAVTEAAPKEKGGGPLQKKARNRWVPPATCDPVGYGSVSG